MTELRQLNIGDPFRLKHNPNINRIISKQNDTITYSRKHEIFTTNQIYKLVEKL